MINSFKDMIRFKANDNAPEPVICGDFAKDAIVLSRHWGQNYAQFNTWAACPAQFSQAMIAAGCSVEMALMPALPNPHARNTAMALATIHTLFALLEHLPDAEAVFVLNRVSDCQSGFIAKRCDKKSTPTNQENKQ